MSAEESKRTRTRTALAGCLTVGLGFLLALVLIFFALPFVSVRGQFVAGRVHRSGGQLIGGRIPRGLNVVPNTFRGQPSDLWILRLGDLYWAVHIPGKTFPISPRGPRRGAGRTPHRARMDRVGWASE